jgi:malonate transporter
MAHTILLALLPIFFVMALGYVAGRWNIVDNHHVEGLNVLVMTFALPASLFAATATASRTEMFAQAPLFLISSGVMLVVFVAWYCLQIRYMKVGKADASLQALTIAFPNLAGVGLPLLADVLGPAGTVPLAIVLASGSIIISPLSLLLVEMYAGKPAANGGHQPKISSSLFHALTKPVVVAPILGILFSLSGFKTNDAVNASLLLIGHAAPGVALFLTGVVLSSQAFQLNRKVITATIMSNLVRPVLTTCVVLLLPIAWDTAKVAILLAAVPSGFFGILFAVNYRLDSGATGSIVIASTVSGIVTLAIAIAVLFPS